MWGMYSSISICTTRPLLCLYLSLSLFSLAGVSRSVTLVVAYIMTVTGLGWQEALAAVRVARPSAGPNLGFQRQLQEFEATQADQVGIDGIDGKRMYPRQLHF